MRFFCLIASLLAFSSLAYTAPPEVPKTIVAKPGDLVTLEVKGKTIGYQPTFSSADVFFARLHTEDPETLSFAIQVKPGRDLKTPLAIVFWTVGEKTGATCILDTGTVAPIDTKPPVTPTPTTGFYFLIARKDGPADPDFTKVMELSAWQDLKKAGHSFKPKTAKELEALGYSLEGITLPAVITLDNSGDNAKIVRSAIPLPGDNTGILALPKGIK